MNKTSPILLGISGGADSLCMLGTLHEQGYPLIIAHFDHQLRPESADDARFVAQIAARYGHPFVTASADVAEYARENRQSIEEAARNLRYRFLFEQARRHNAQAVAVGHTADDQVETVLMHFLRGAGLSGLKGISERTILPAFDPEIPLIRPILHLWRADTVAYCRAHDLHPLEDPSNASLDYFRNRLRHRLIPELEGYNPRFRETLQRTSLALQGDYELISELTRATWQKIVTESTPHYISFNLSSFAELSPPLIRNLIKFSMEKLCRDQVDISFSTLDRAARFITSPQTAQRIDLGLGLILLNEQGILYLADSPQSLPLDAFPQLPRSGDFNPLRAEALITKEETFPRSEGFSPVIASGAKQSPSPREEIASAIKLPRNDNDWEITLGSGWVLTAKHLSAPPKLKNADPFRVALDADALGETLILRPRRAGERFQPLGMENQSMKIKDFMINVKLPRRARENYPLLCAGDEIAWVPGYQIGHRFRVTNETKEVILFELLKTDRKNE